MIFWPQLRAWANHSISYYACSFYFILVCFVRLNLSFVYLRYDVDGIQIVKWLLQWIILIYFSVVILLCQDLLKFIYQESNMVIIQSFIISFFHFWAKFNAILFVADVIKLYFVYDIISHCWTRLLVCLGRPEPK